MGENLRGGLGPFWGMGAGSPSKTFVAFAEAYLPTKWQLDPSSRLATRHVPLIIRTQARPARTQARPARTQARPAPVNFVIGGCSARFRGGGAGSPCNTVWPVLRPTCVWGFIVIQPTVWPQYSNVADRRTDRQTDRQTTVR